MQAWQSPCRGHPGQVQGQSGLIRFALISELLSVLGIHQRLAGIHRKTPPHASSHNHSVPVPMSCIYCRQCQAAKRPKGVHGRRTGRPERGDRRPRWAFSIHAPQGLRDPNFTFSRRLAVSGKGHSVPVPIILWVAGFNCPRVAGFGCPLTPIPILTLCTAKRFITASRTP